MSEQTLKKLNGGRPLREVTVIPFKGTAKNLGDALVDSDGLTKLDFTAGEWNLRLPKKVVDRDHEFGDFPQVPSSLRFMKLAGTSNVYKRYIKTTFRYHRVQVVCLSMLASSRN